MKKILLTLLISSGLVFADDHGMEKDTYYAFFGIAANNPPAVVAAMDKFNASDCGQASPSSVALMGEAFNGNEPSTHTFVVTYEGAEEIDETLSIINACPEYAEFLTEMAAVSVPTEQILNKVVYEVGDWTQERAFAVFEMNVRNEASYLEAYKKFTDASVASGLLTGAFGIQRAIASSEYTHFAFIGAENMTELMGFMNSLDMDNPDFAEFQNSVRRNRSIVRRGIVVPIKGWD